MVPLFPSPDVDHHNYEYRIHRNFVVSGDGVHDAEDRREEYGCVGEMARQKKP